MNIGIDNYRLNQIPETSGLIKLQRWDNPFQEFSKSVKNWTENSVVCNGRVLSFKCMKSTKTDERFHDFYTFYK